MKADKRKAAYNSTFEIDRVLCSPDSFVFAGSTGHRMNIFTENPSITSLQNVS